MRFCSRLAPTLDTEEHEELLGDHYDPRQSFLVAATGPVEFMQELLALEGMLNRIVGYGERRDWPKGHG